MAGLKACATFVTVALCRALAVAVAPLAALGVAGQPETSGPLTAQDGQRLGRKISQIHERDATGGSEVQRLVVFEREVNAHLRFQGASQLPPSVTLPKLSILGQGRVIAEVMIDLDILRESRQRGVLDLLNYLGGKVPVMATGVVQATGGVGQVTVEAVEIAGISVPPAVLYQLVRYYTRGESYPEGFDLAAPFELPYSIRAVAVEVGRAVVVQ